MENPIATIFIANVLLFGFTMQNFAGAAQQCDYSKPETTPISRFEINQTDGTVSDTKTKLIWKICPEGQSYSEGHCTGSATNFTWDNAMQTFGDTGDSWRLPNVEELSSLVEERCRNPAINMAIFANVTETHFWSARNPDFSWGVNFDKDSFDMDSFVTYFKKGDNFVRLVRDNDPLKKEREQADLAARKKMAPVILRKNSKDEFCVTYGEVLRGEKIEEIGELLPGIAMKLVKAESLRRKLIFNDSLIRKAQVRIGMSECQLYAAWGLPSDQNRTVGSWGVHIQHIYGSTYVYTENGRVTSWQD